MNCVKGFVKFFFFFWHLATFMVLYPSMVDMSIHVKGQTENVALVRAVSHQERPIRLIQELDLRLIPAQRAPVPTTLTKVIEKIGFICIQYIHVQLQKEYNILFFFKFCVVKILLIQ